MSCAQEWAVCCCIAYHCIARAIIRWFLNDPKGIFVLRVAIVATVWSFLQIFLLSLSLLIYPVALAAIPIVFAFLWVSGLFWLLKSLLNLGRTMLLEVTRTALRVPAYFILVALGVWQRVWERMHRVMVPVFEVYYTINPYNVTLCTIARQFVKSVLAAGQLSWIVGREVADLGSKPMRVWLYHMERLVKQVEVEHNRPRPEPRPEYHPEHRPEYRPEHRPEYLQEHRPAPPRSPVAAAAEAAAAQPADPVPPAPQDQPQAEGGEQAVEQGGDGGGDPPKRDSD